MGVVGLLEAQDGRPMPGNESVEFTLVLILPTLAWWACLSLPPYSMLLTIVSLFHWHLV